jgi:hypothetical protein
VELTSKCLSNIELVISERDHCKKYLWVSTNSFGEIEVDKRKVLALDMGNGNLIACLSTHKDCEVVVPLFALASKLATTISKRPLPMARGDPIHRQS